ncbi:MAG: selenocysteine-specific translation elongation factor [Lachnospiraceae bacterium]|nr:selenocysteine-specific translation elongation factor [Lachnospiraceae bacterium]
MIKALTGRNTDRWEEEQRRGITIDLGFTYFDLPCGDRVGIIDVPGHERFINNMVAGVVGMDLVLLVIAADEGIMPQTKEHVDILSLLGIEKSIIVLNKCDLVDEEWLELVEEEVKEELAGTFLEHAPVVKVSAASGEGLEALIHMIEKMTSDEVVAKDVRTIPRLPVDRAFSLSGFGTIITGTLVSGTISKEDTLQMYPVGKECKIRSIQVHGQDREECYAGQRVAVNLSNVKKREIKRGCVLAPKNSMKNTDLLDVKLKILDSSVRILTNHMRLHFFTGTSEVLCRAVLLDQEEIGPGESGYVQLRLEEEVAVRRGDKFVVRFYSPMETIGGGVVLEPNPGVKRRFQQDVIEELKRKESGSTADVIEMHVRGHGDTLITLAELAKLTALSPDEVAEDVKTLESQGLVFVFSMRKDTFVWHSDSRRAAEQTLEHTLRAYEEKYPYRYGMKKAEVQAAYFKKIKPNVFDKILEMLIEAGCLRRVDEFLCTPGFEVRKDGVYDRVSGVLLDSFRKAKYDFVRYSEIAFGGADKAAADDILNILLEEQKIVKVTDDMYTLSEYMEHAVDVIRKKLEEDPLITIAQVRDLFETSRKSAKPILEYMDSIKVTKKMGAESERVAY